MRSAAHLRGHPGAIGASRVGIHLNWALVVALATCLAVWALLVSAVVILT